MKRVMKESCIIFLGLSVVTGIIYPLVVTAFSQILFPQQANGSLVKNDDGLVIGSSLIAQKFESSRYFWPRPSAADFATVASGASNLAPTSSKLKESLAERRQLLLKAHPFRFEGEIPTDLLMTSASGLDPHISKSAALFQLQRVVAARHWDFSQQVLVERLILEMTEGLQWFVFGEERVNVLLLNRAIDFL